VIPLCHRENVTPRSYPLPHLSSDVAGELLERRLAVGRQDAEPAVIVCWFSVNGKNDLARQARQ
jgi:hypothetical protein